MTDRHSVLSLLMFTRQHRLKLKLTPVDVSILNNLFYRHSQTRDDWLREVAILLLRTR